MDFLVLSPTATFPLDYGNRWRVYSICSFLQKRGAKITFLFYPWENEWIDGTPYSEIHSYAMREMQKQWETFHFLPATLTEHSRPRYGDDHCIDEWWDPSIGDYLRWIFRFRKFKCFIVNYPYLSKALTFAPEDTYTILDMHDRFSGRREYLQQFGIFPEFFHLNQEQENIALNRADLVWAIKDQEAVYFTSQTDTPVITMPYLQQNSRKIKGSEKIKKAFRVGFLGARNNINKINIKKFISIFLSRAKLCESPIIFVLAGSVCFELQEYRDHPMVDLMGYIPDVDAFYMGVDLVASPISFSTGLKIKVIETLQKGVPIVGMAHSFEGIPTKSPYHSYNTIESIVDICLYASRNNLLLHDIRKDGALVLSKLTNIVNHAMDKTLDMVRVHGQ